jgi:type VI protein secretion system component VasF
MPETPSAAATQPTPDHLISFLKAIPDGRYRRGVRYPQWFLLLVAVLGIYCFSSRRLRLRRRLTPTAAAAVPAIWRPLLSGTEIC